MIDRLALLEELSVHCLSLVTDDPSTLGGLVLLDMQAAHNRDEGCDFLQITCRINQRDFWHEELVGSQTQPLWTANKYASEQIYGVPPAAREPRLHPGVTLLRMAAQHGSPDMNADHFYNLNVKKESHLCHAPYVLCQVAYETCGALWVTSGVHPRRSKSFTYSPPKLKEQHCKDHVYLLMYLLQVYVRGHTACGHQFPPPPCGPLGSSSGAQPWQQAPPPAHPSHWPTSTSTSRGRKVRIQLPGKPWRP